MQDVVGIGVGDVLPPVGRLHDLMGARIVSAGSPLRRRCLKDLLGLVKFGNVVELHLRLELFSS